MHTYQSDRVRGEDGFFFLMIIQYMLIVLMLLFIFLVKHTSFKGVKVRSSFDSHFSVDKKQTFFTRKHIIFKHMIIIHRF